MRDAALVFAGGAVGSLARHLVGLALPGLWPVFVVNVVGSFALGLLLGWRRQPALQPPTASVPRADSQRGGPSGVPRGLRLLLGTGFLGGFTTYSAFAVDTVSLTLVGGPLPGLAFGAGQVASGLVAALVGFALADASGARRRPAGVGA